MLEKIGYIALSILGLLWLWMTFAGLAESRCGSVVAALLVIGIGALLLKVLRERLGNVEDNHYDRTVDK
jgi:hypothetical protein